MPHILRLRDIYYYPLEEWDIGSVLAKRRALMCELPIISADITELELWLVEQPDLPLEDAAEIWTRMTLVTSIMYGLEKDPETKHSMLLSLREHFAEFKKLPQKWQEHLGPCWVPWLNVLNREERQEKLQ